MRIPVYLFGPLFGTSHVNISQSYLMILTFFRCHFCSPPFVPRWRWLPGPHWRAATTVATPHSAPWTATRPASGRRTARRRATRRESTLGYPSRHMGRLEKIWGTNTWLDIHTYIYIYNIRGQLYENERDSRGCEILMAFPSMLPINGYLGCRKWDERWKFNHMYVIINWLVVWLPFLFSHILGC